MTSQQPGPAASGGASSNGASGPGAVERATPKRGLGPDRATIGRGPAAFMSGRSTEKSLDFRGSSKRLLREMAPERVLAAVALLLAVVNIALTVTGPRLLGEATNIIFTGVISQRIPAGTTKAEVIAGLQHEGKGAQAGGALSQKCAACVECVLVRFHNGTVSGFTFLLKRRSQ